MPRHTSSGSRAFPASRRHPDEPGGRRWRAPSRPVNFRFRYLPRQARKFVPGACVEDPAARFRRAASPLLEEERHLGHHALVADLSHPQGVNRTMAGPALASHNYPVDALHWELRNRAEEWLDREEPDA